jgi:hypothetical protein
MLRMIVVVEMRRFRKPNMNERDDLEKDLSKDEVTGVDLIKGG